MAGHNYLTKGYPTNMVDPTCKGGSDQGTKKPFHGHLTRVETKKTEHAFTPDDYTGYSGSPTKIELLKEYVHTPNMSTEFKYVPQDPTSTKVDCYEGYGLSRPINNGPKEGMDKSFGRVHAGANQPVKASDLSSPNWQSANPMPTRHPLVTPVNHTNKSASLLKEHVNSSANHPKKGVLDELSTRGEPVEPARRYAKPIFGALSNKSGSTTASKKYHNRK